MEGDDLYSIVVPTNGLTVSLLAGAIVSSSTPSSHTLPRTPCAENQTVHQVSVVGTRHENNSSGSPVSRPSPDRSRILEPSTATRRRARSKLRSKFRSRSKSRSRTKKTSCSPTSRQTRPESKSPKRERRSCSVTSTCSKYCGSSSPNRRSPPSRPLSKDRRKKEIELKKTQESPNRTSSGNYVNEAPTKISNDVAIRNDSDVQKTKHFVKSTTELAILSKENPKMTPDLVTAKDFFNSKLFKDGHTNKERDSLNMNDRSQVPDANIRRDKAKQDCKEELEETVSKKLPADAVVNYMTEWLTCVDKIKSFYSDPVDCTGFEACPPLRERMAQHRLKHHTGHGFVPHVSTKRYAFEDSGPQLTENLQRTGKTEMPARETVDQPVQTKLTLGELGELIIKLGKSIKISEENNKDPKKRRRSTLRGNDYANDKNRRSVTVDYKKHRISRLDSDRNIPENSQNYGQNNYGVNNTDFDNEGRKMSQMGNSYNRNRQNSSSKRRSQSNVKGAYNRYSEDKTLYNDRRRQTYDDANKNDDVINQEKLDTNSYRKYSTIPNDNNENHIKDRADIENDDIRNQDRLDMNGYKHNNNNNKFISKNMSNIGNSKARNLDRLYMNSTILNNNNENDIKDRADIENDDIRKQDRLDMNSYRKYSIKPNNNNNEFISKNMSNIGNNNARNQDRLYMNTERKYSTKPHDHNEYDSKIKRTNIGKNSRKTQNNNTDYSFINRISTNEENKISANNYAFSEQNPDIATSSKFQDNNVTKGLSKPLNNLNDNNILLVNNSTYNSISPYPDNNELNEVVQDWLKNVPLFPDISEKDTLINELLEKINDLSHAPIRLEESDQILEALVSEHLDKYHAWYPMDKREQEDYKRNLIQSFVQTIKPIFKRIADDENNRLGPGDQMEGLDGWGNTNGRRYSNMRRFSRSKYYKRVHKRGIGDNLIRCTISSNIICGDPRVKKRKPSEKYKPEFAQEICKWLARYDFVKHDGLQQISMHDLVGILLTRLSPYLDRPYNSTNKLILKAKIVDIINSLPICIHHSPDQKTQVIKFADELANMLLNIQTRLDDNDDSSMYRRPVKRQSELMYITNAVEMCKKYYFRTQLSEQLKQCLENTMLSNHLSIQNQLTEVVLNYFELLQSGQKDIAKNALIKVLDESNVNENDKITIVNSIIGSLELLSAKETIDNMRETKLPSRNCFSRLHVGRSEMEICDTVFAVSTRRLKKEPGLSAEEYEYFEIVADVIRDWAETLPQSFSKLRKKQKEEFMYELAKDMLIQNRIEKIRPIPETEREKFWMFFAYRWFYRLNIFEDLNDAEPYGSALCRKMNETLQARMVTHEDSPKEANEIEIESDSSSADSKNSKKMKSQERAEERERRKKEKEEEKKIKLQAREEAKQKKMKEKEETKQKRLQEKQEAKQKILKDKKEAKQKRLKEREARKGKSSKNSESSNESENLESSEKDKTTQESASDEQCTSNCKKLNTVQLDDELPIARNPNDTHKWKCATLSFQCLQKNQDPKTVTSLPPSTAYQEKNSSPKTPPTVILPSQSPKDSTMHSSCLPETVDTSQPPPKFNWKEKYDLAQHCPCPRRHRHSHRRKSEKPPNFKDTEKCDQTQMSCQNYLKGNNDNTKLVQTSSLVVLQQNQDPKYFVTNNEKDDIPINLNITLKGHERYKEIYQVKDLRSQDKRSLLNAPMENSNDFTPIQKKNILLDHDTVMKEFIKKYLEYSYNMDDPLIRTAFFHVLEIELQKTRAYYKLTKSTRHPLSPETLEEELKYAKLISDWLKEMPLEKSFNTSMNKDRIYFVKDLAKNITQIQLDRIRAPNFMNYNMCLERVIRKYVIQLPLLRDEQDKILAMIDQLTNKINKSSCTGSPNNTSLNFNTSTEHNMVEFLDKNIRCNEEYIKNDELILNIWAHLLVEEVLKNIEEVNVTQVLNFPVDPHVSDNAAFRFRLELDYVNIIIEFLNNLPLLSLKTGIRVKKIHELSKRLLVRDLKITINPNDKSADQEFVEFVKKWTMDLSLNFDKEENFIDVIIHDLEKRIKILNRDCTQTAIFEILKCITLEDQSPTINLYQKSLLDIDAHRKVYRLALSNVIDDVLSKPKDLNADKRRKVEIIKDEILDSFIWYNYNKDNDEIQSSCKKKMIESVFEYLDAIKNINETISLEIPLVRGNQLITKMSKVAKPNNSTMIEEIQEVRMKYEVNELFESLLPKASGSKLEAINKVKTRLAKRLHEIEKTSRNAENTEKIKEEISKAMIEIGANPTQVHLNEFIRNLKKNETIRMAPSSGSHKTSSNVFCDRNFGNFRRVHASMFRTDPTLNDSIVPNYSHRRFSEDYSMRPRTFSTHTGHPCHSPLSGQKFTMQVNLSHREFERKRYSTLYSNSQRRAGTGNQPLVQSGGGPPLQQDPTMGCHVIRTSGTAQVFEAYNDQVVKPQPENIFRGNEVQQRMEQRFFGRCSCSISEFENCCGRSHDPGYNTIEMIGEQTSTAWLDSPIPYQQNQNEAKGCGIKQLTHDSHIVTVDSLKSENESRRKQSEVRASTTQQDHGITGQQTTACQTIAVQITEQGCAAEQCPQEVFADQKPGQTPDNPPPVPNPESYQAPNVLTKTVSQYNTAPGTTFTHLRDDSNQVDPGQTALPPSNKPSHCKAILSPPESTPEVSPQQSLLSGHQQILYSHNHLQNSDSREANSRQNQLQMTKCCSQDEHHQFRVLSIPGPEYKRHDSNPPSYGFFGLSRRLMIGIARQTRSLSPGHYNLFSPTIQPGLKRQYLYTIKHGRSFYTLKDHPACPHSKQNLSASLEQQNLNASCSNIHAQIYQPVATSTDTISCRSAKVATRNSGSNFGDEFRIQFVQEHKNLDHNFCNQFGPDPFCGSNLSSISDCPYPNLDRCSLHEEDDRAGKKCYVECKGYDDCAHIPVFTILR